MKLIGLVSVLMIFTGCALENISYSKHESPFTVKATRNYLPKDTRPQPAYSLKNIFIVVFLLVLVGCATVQPITQSIPDINQEKTASIGDTFFAYSSMAPRDPMATLLSDSGISRDARFDLTILELGDKIGLQYSEYYYHVNPYTYKSGWAVKEGFNKRFDYPADVGTVNFKGYEFEVISVDKGKITYKRIQ